jgi:hypothetical protein
MRQRENHVHIRDIQQFRVAGSEPLVTSVGLALWAMAVTTRVVGDGLLTAARALIQMAAERGRAAALDSPQHANMLPAQSGSILLDKASARCLNDIGHLEGGAFISCAVCGSASLASVQRTQPCRWAYRPLSDDVQRDAGKWRSLLDRSAPTATARSASPLRPPASASRNCGVLNGGERVS